MKLFDCVNFLGMYWNEPELQPLLDEFAVNKPPKIAKGETDGRLLLKKSGVELIFTDERSVKVPNKNFPEGAMVLSNITFYLTATNGYKVYSGHLPDGIKPNVTKNEVLNAFGLPNNLKYSPTGQLLPDQDDWIMRWDKQGFVIFFTFTDEGIATDLALQLPLDQA